MVLIRNSRALDKFLGNASMRNRPLERVEQMRIFSIVQLNTRDADASGNWYHYSFTQTRNVDTQSVNDGVKQSV